jgi:hypothetical protein
MDGISDLSKLAHIGVAMAMIGGLVGSRILNRRAAHSDQIVEVVRLTRAAAPFDRIASVSGPLIILTGLLAAWAAGLPWLGLTTPWIAASLAIIAVLIVLIAVVFQPDGKRVEAAIQAAQAAGDVTPSLRAAFEPTGAKRVAYWYGDFSPWAIVALMVLKPG